MTRLPAELVLSLGLITAVGLGCQPVPIATLPKSTPTASEKLADKPANDKDEKKTADEATKTADQSKPTDAEKKPDFEEKKADEKKPD